MSVSRAWPAILAALLAMVGAHGAAPHTLAALVDAVISKGPPSQLPAHLSMVLGLSRIEQPTAVKQAVMRDGATVRTFNVCTAHHSDVVMIAYNEISRASKVYLASPAGTLRKAVSLQAGEPAVERTLADARSDFDAEIRFWNGVQHEPGTSK